MRVILAITHLAHDEQLVQVELVVKRNGGSIVQLCTNSGGNFDFALKSDGQNVSIFAKGKEFMPKVIWYATHPRTDALFCKRFRFPGEHRTAMSQFIMDLHYAYYSTVLWFPGDIHLVGQADSKPVLFKEARLCGLFTPSVTMNATLQTKQKVLSQRMYKKKLGFPCVVTFDQKRRLEVATTTENSLGVKNAGREVWQWQTPVESCAHVRCCVVGKEIWAVVWRRKSTIGKLYDYRSREREEEWRPYVLPTRTVKSLMRLKRKLKLEIACPEFLVSEDGEHIFIDMNPCGDWHGFFEEPTRSKIANAIARLLMLSS